MKTIIYTLTIFYCSFAVPLNLTKIPNSSYVKKGSKTSCQICHEYATPTVSTSARNNFGTDFANFGHYWNQGLGNTDSDKDGFSNAAELQCYNFSWISGECGSNYINATNPGDGSISLSTKSEEQSIEESTIYFSVFPNPFNPSTTISIHNPLQKNITQIFIFNQNGKKVKSLAIKSKINSSVTWNGTDDNGNLVPSGIYFAEIVGLSAIKKSCKLILIH